MARGRSSRGRSRGEVNEVINQLENLSAMDGRRPDVVQSKRECFQKLIRYMTAGIDMSAVFIPATKCVALSKFDLPLKKMLYLYLRSAARQNEAVALLVVQTLLTDCKDADPTIRGLAVRSMCSLRVPDLMENVVRITLFLPLRTKRFVCIIYMCHIPCSPPISYSSKPLIYSPNNIQTHIDFCSFQQLMLVLKTITHT